MHIFLFPLALSSPIHRDQMGWGGLTECEGGWSGVWKKRREKKASPLSWRAITSTLKYSPVGRKMRWYSYDRQTGDFPHSSSPLSIRAEARWTLNMYNPENVLIFHLAKKGHKNHITWNCHSSFVHSSFLLMFGFCHKLSLITRYSELQSLSPQRHSHTQPAGLNKTAHIYYIWHTPRSFCFISD